MISIIRKLIKESLLFCKGRLVLLYNFIKIFFTKALTAVSILFIFLRNALVWLTPFFVFLIVVFLAIYFFKGNIDKYIELIKVLVWPVSILISLFFFRKVFTYLFFSINEFNFFGTKGTLKNVNDLINEEVEKRFLQEKEDNKRKGEMNKIKADLAGAKGSAEENSKIADRIFELWTKDREEKDKIINELRVEIKNQKNSSINKISDVENESFENKIGAGEQIGKEAVENLV